MQEKAQFLILNHKTSAADTTTVPVEVLLPGKAFAEEHEDGGKAKEEENLEAGAAHIVVEFRGGYPSRKDSKASAHKIGSGIGGYAGHKGQ